MAEELESGVETNLDWGKTIHAELARGMQRIFAWQEEKLMSNTELLIRLRDLHEELAVINDDLKNTDSVDEQTIDALGQLVTDVSQLVDQTKDVMGPDNEENENHDLLDQIMRFETEHPRVIKFLSQMTDLLAMMGI